MVILSNKEGIEIRTLRFNKIDVDLNDTRDFQLIISANEWNRDITYGCRVFIPETEYGGIVGAKKTSTEDNTVIISGQSWRGILYTKIIKPPTGEAYKNVTGELNTVLKSLIAEAGLAAIFSVSEENTGVSVENYQFDRYTTLLEGINKMLASKNYKISIRYVQGERGQPGYINLSAEKAIDYSTTIELSQDQRLNFTFEEIKNGTNHLICLGKGELTDRVVVDLYVQKDGSIGNTQHYKGSDENAKVYENTSAENEVDLTEKGIEELKKLTSKQKFQMDVETLNIDVDIGDIVGGRDYITGMSMAKPIINKIYTEQNGVITKEYKLEGDEQ